MRQMKDQGHRLQHQPFDNEIQMAELEGSDATRLNIKPQVDQYTFPNGQRDLRACRRGRPS